MLYKILGEIDISREIEIEASSYEDAVSKFYSLKPETVELKLRPSWIGNSEYVAKCGEFEHEIIGPCEWCHIPLISRKIDGQPWNYGLNPENEHGGSVCYSCLKNKGYIDEKGNIKYEW